VIDVIIPRDGPHQIYRLTLCAASGYSHRVAQPSIHFPVIPAIVVLALLAVLVATDSGSNANPPSS
jgi:hypothetical protein